MANNAPFYGIWYEAWAACLKAHNIDRTDREEKRCTEAAESSYYNPAVPKELREVR